MKTLFAILAIALLAGCGGGKSYEEPKAPVETPTAGTQTTLGGVRGASFTDRATGNSIFLPASYGRDDVEPFFDGTGAFACYWTASESQEHPGNYLLFRFTSFGVGDFTTGSAAAFAVRCVRLRAAAVAG